MRPNEVDQWLALWEPMLVGQPKDVAAAHVLAAGLTPHTTHYVTGAAAPQPDVINLLIGPNGLVRTATSARQVVGPRPCSPGNSTP